MFVSDLDKHKFKVFGGGEREKVRVPPIYDFGHLGPAEQTRRRPEGPNAQKGLKRCFGLFSTAQPREITLYYKNGQELYLKVKTSEGNVTLKYDEN